jgi:hypothetical protein
MRMRHRVTETRYSASHLAMSRHCSLGWTAVGTPLADYLREVGRPVPGPDSEAGPMIGRNTLVSAVKAKPSGAARSATAVAFSGLLICWLPTGTLVGFPPTTNRADTCAA